MKKSVFLFLLALPLIVSCGPSAYTMAFQMRYPSQSGFDLAGKSMSVVYVHKNQNDSIVVAGIADAFAASLEEEYFGGQRAVELFAIQEEDGGVYSAKDTLVNLAIDTDSDVVFLFDAPHFGDPVFSNTTRSGKTDPDSVFVSQSTLPFQEFISVYDSFGVLDTVAVFIRKGQIQTEYYSPIGRTETQDEQVEKIIGVTLDGMGKAGKTFAKPFLNDWKTENYTFYYYENERWFNALNLAYAMDWKKAIDAFLELASSSDPVKRSCAAFDIATCLYMSGDYDMASEWLSKSDSDYKQANSPSLRQRIKNRRKM